MVFSWLFWDRPSPGASSRRQSINRLPLMPPFLLLVCHACFIPCFPSQPLSVGHCLLSRLKVVSGRYSICRRPTVKPAICPASSSQLPTCGDISLTYKSGFPILPSNENKFLSKKARMRLNVSDGYINFLYHSHGRGKGDIGRNRSTRLKNLTEDEHYEEN